VMALAEFEKKLAAAKAGPKSVAVQ
jgi:hypothetical protein